MQYFSQEYLAQLHSEHKLISESIRHLTGQQFARFCKSHTRDTVTKSIDELIVERVKIEAKIDIITDFLSQ